MKKVLLTSLILGSSVASFAQAPFIQATSPGGAFDSFESAKEYSNEAGPDYDLGIYMWKDTNSTTIPYYKRVAAVPTALNDGVLKSKQTRLGDGVITYTVSQPHGLFIPQVGLTFGKGKSLDLTGASEMSLRIGFKMDMASLAATQTSTTAAGIKVKFSLKDANDVGIDSKGTKGGTTDQWQDEIFVVIDKTGAFTFPASLKNTITIEPSATETGVTFVTVNFSTVGTTLAYEAIYPKLTDALYVTDENCVGDLRGDQNIKGASAPKTNFDASKVAGFALTFLQNEQLASDCYFKTALNDLTFSITEFKLGTVTVGLSDEELFNSNAVVSVYDIMGSFVGTGKVQELGLESGKLYVVKAGNKSRKIVMN